MGPLSPSLTQLAEQLDLSAPLAPLGGQAQHVLGVVQRRARHAARPACKHRASARPRALTRAPAMRRLFLLPAALPSQARSSPGDVGQQACLAVLQRVQGRRQVVHGAARATTQHSSKPGARWPLGQWFISNAAAGPDKTGSVEVGVQHRCCREKLGAGWVQVVRREAGQWPGAPVLGVEHVNGEADVAQHGLAARARRPRLGKAQQRRDELPAWRRSRARTGSARSVFRSWPQQPHPPHVHTAEVSKQMQKSHTHSTGLLAVTRSDD